MTETALFSDVAGAGGVPEGHSVVRLPDGSLTVVSNEQIKTLNAAADAAAQAAADEPEPETEYYVWLADGSVVRVKETDLPGHAGTNALHGFFKRDGFNFVIVGVYPVESKA
jgi:hypothetical protein